MNSFLSFIDMLWARWQTGFHKRSPRAERALFLLTAVTLLSVLLATIYIFSRIHVYSLRLEKLIVWPNNINELHFSRTLDSGINFHLLLAIPKSKDDRDSDPFRGTITITAPGKLSSGPIQFDSDNIGYSDWQVRTDLNAYVLTADPDQFDEKSDCDFVVKFAEGPPAGASLWLGWLSEK